MGDQFQMPLFGLSAFRLHRTPPQIRQLIPSFPDLTVKSERLSVGHNPAVLATCRTPIHVFAESRNLYHGSTLIKAHTISRELPSEPFWYDEDLDVSYASPLFTLLGMASHLSTVELAMAMYELCGSFSIYQPAPQHQFELDRLEAQKLVWPGGWRQVRDTAGRPTSLWKRDPLITVQDLVDFRGQIYGMHGAKKFAAASKLVTGPVASPLEAQASMILHAPRRQGGEGFPAFRNNHRIALTAQARAIACQETCWADIFFPQSNEHGALDIECHGHTVHDGAQQGGIDANRALALQSMGIEVIHLTNEQLANRARLENTLDYIASFLKVPRAPKTESMLQAQSKLDANLFMDWRTLGS